MSQFGRLFGTLILASIAASPALAAPTATEVLTNMGVSAADQQRVMNGEFVTGDVPGVSDRDLSISIAFIVKASPDALAAEVVSGGLVGDDPQVKAHGTFKGDGSLDDLAGLTIDAATAQALTNASAGEKMNLSTAEIASFNALNGAAPSAVAQQLRQMLLARFQSYRSSGLGGLAPYDRGGSSSDVASDLRKASSAAAGLKKYLPAFQQLLVDYPNAPATGVQQASRWLKYDIDGTITFVLTHMLVASDGDVRAVVQRQYYASTGYNAEQAVAGFLPVEGGTVVAYTNHTFTDQVAGWGGSAKRSIGRNMMTSKLKAMFDRERQQLAQ